MSEPVFVDTSALYAALDADDEHHAAAAATWGRLLDGTTAGSIEGVTHGSVVVEASALVQRRLGMRAVRALHDGLLPVLSLHWVDQQLHSRAVSALLAGDRREVSLVDWTSFELMRALGVGRAFAFDDDFVTQGFTRFV
ncbi:MAG TPA: PIN domain-containing protein [Acidimicrobiia bacterium]|nr:PIN domain-containing protein [Acidimicrobiia bacterium]